MICFLAFIINITGYILEQSGDPVFRPLYQLICTAGAIALVFILPSLGMAKQLRRAFGLGWEAALFIGSALSMAAVPLLLFWTARLTGFALLPVSATLALFSILLISGGRTPVVPRTSETFSNSMERRVFWMATGLFILIVSTAFIHTGRVSWQGAALPAIGDWKFINGVTCSILETGIPPDNPFFGPRVIAYYYFFHIYIAVFVLLSAGGLSIPGASALVVAIGVGVVMMAFFCTAREWLKSFSGALFATLSITYIGGFDIIGNALARQHGFPWSLDIDFWTKWTVFKIHTPISAFHYISQHVLGILFFWLFFYFVTIKSSKKWFFCALCLAAGLGYSSWGIFGAIPSIGVYLLINLIAKNGAIPWGRWWRRWLKEGLKIAIIGCIALAAVSPIYLKAIHGDYIGGSPVRCWRIPPMHCVRWIPDGYQPPNIVAHIMGLALIEVGEFGPLILLGVPGLFLIRRIREVRARNMLLAVFLTNFFLINSLNAGGVNPGECISKIDGLFAWWALAILSGLFFRERYRVELKSGKISSLHKGWLRGKAANLAILAAVVLGLASTVYGFVVRMNYIRMPAEDYIAYTYLSDNLPGGSKIQRSPFYDVAPIPSWSRRTTPFATRYQAWEYLVPVLLVKKAEAEIEGAFSSDDPAHAHRVLSRYRADYVFLGELERKRYSGEALAKFHSSPELFRPVWKFGQTEIIEVVKRPN